MTRDDVIGWLLYFAFNAGIGLFIWFSVTMMNTTSVKAESGSVPYKLQWKFVTITANGLGGGTTPERQQFDGMAECAAFGALHITRMEDWVRGLLRADWTHPVRVAFDCAPVGDPA